MEDFLIRLAGLTEIYNFQKRLRFFKLSFSRLWQGLEVTEKSAYFFLKFEVFLKVNFENDAYSVHIYARWGIIEFITPVRLTTNGKKY